MIFLDFCNLRFYAIAIVILLKFSIFFLASIAQFIFSTATDGKIKAWLYDNLGSRVDYDAPGHSSTMMAYSADGARFVYVLCILQFRLSFG